MEPGEEGGDDVGDSVWYKFEAPAGGGMRGAVAGMDVFSIDTPSLEVVRMRCCPGWTRRKCIGRTGHSMRDRVHAHWEESSCRWNCGCKELGLFVLWDLISQNRGEEWLQLLPFLEEKWRPHTTNE